jgi:hypothetical protein
LKLPIIVPQGKNPFADQIPQVHHPFYPIGVFNPETISSSSVYRCLTYIGRRDLPTTTERSPTPPTRNPSIVHVLVIRLRHRIK